MADKLKIAKHFILSSPYGQLKDVIADVSTIVGDSSVLTAAALGDLRTKYSQDRCHFAKAKDGQTVLVSAVGAVDATHYLEPKSGMVYQFDHEKLEFVGAAAESASKLNADVEGYRAAIDSAISRYSDSFFEKAKCAHSVYGANNGTVHVAISARNVNLPAYWSGGWCSVYSLSVSATGEVAVQGRVKVNVHYFEEGNVQLDATIAKSSIVAVSADVDATGRAVAAAVEKLETEFHREVEEFYVNMNQNTFKAMRRFLPVSRKPMEWNSTAHKLAADLNK